MTLRRFKVLVEWDPAEQVWVTYVPGLNHLSTYGDTREEAIENTKQAILGYFEASAKEGLQPPAVPETELIELELAIA